MKNNVKCLTAVAIVTAIATMTYAQAPVRKIAQGKMPEPVKVKIGDKKSLAMPAKVASQNVDFTVKGGSEANTVVWSENFDNGIPSSWELQNGSHNVWELKKTSGDKAFSNIDPADAGSLFIEGDYRIFNRETVHAISQPVTIGQNASLFFYLGFSQNYDGYCRLYVSASTDDFNEDIVDLWNSGQENGEKPWRWHEVNIDLSHLSGKTVKFRFTYGYGSDDEIFKSGGYFGDFSLDGIELRSATSVDHVDVMTGEEVTFVDLTPEGEAVSWLWNFPGAYIETSTEQNPTVYYTDDGAYDVSLTVTNAEGESSTVTKTAFVNVTGTEPVAKIGLPATFRYATTHLPMVAPMAPVTYTDASSGFPTSSEWTFTGVCEDQNTVTELSGDAVEVRYHFMHEQSIGLQSANRHGTSGDGAQVSVEYDGLISNLLPDDFANVFDLDGRGEFPGTNTMKITAYAEKFSKPSRPIVVYGAYVYFNKAEAEELIDQISSIGVHLCTSENGLPGKRIDSWWWTVTDINYDVNNGAVATAFPFTDKPVVDDEFFIVVDGIPAKSDGCTVSFYMADFRDSGNTAYMLKDGQWIDVSTYFPAGKNHTSYMIVPSICHSVISNLPMGAEPTVKFDRNGGEKEYEIFSIMGYKTPIQSSDDWVRVTSEPNGMTVDKLTIEADPLPSGMIDRKATLTLTDGASTFEIPVEQDSTDGIDTTIAETTTVSPAVFTESLTVTGAEGSMIVVSDLSGRITYKSMIGASGTATIDTRAWTSGVYLVKAGNARATKAIKH